MLGSRRSAIIIASFVALATALPVLALSGSTDLPAAVTERAERLLGDEEDVVTVFNSGALTQRRCATGHAGSDRCWRHR